MLGCFVRSLLRPAVHAAVATRFVAPRRAGVQVCDLFRCFVVSFRSAVIGRDSPRRRPGSRAFDSCRLAFGCFRLATIGRVSPRRATTFVVATRKVDKEGPLPQRRLGRPGCARQGNARERIADSRLKRWASAAAARAAAIDGVRRFRGEQSCIRPCRTAVRHAAYALRRRIAPTPSRPSAANARLPGSGTVPPPVLPPPAAKQMMSSSVCWTVVPPTPLAPCCT